MAEHEGGGGRGEEAKGEAGAGAGQGGQAAAEKRWKSTQRPNISVQQVVFSRVCGFICVELSDHSYG